MSQGRFSNSSPIVIPQTGTAGNAAPFPARIEVKNWCRPVKKVTVTINNFVHTFPDDVHFMLVGPEGQSTYLMGNAGGDVDVNGITITFDDDALNPLPDGGPMVSGRFRPTLFGAPNPNLPGPLFGTNLSVFKGKNPNGIWSLYSLDDANGDVGFVSGGWTLTIYYN